MAAGSAVSVLPADMRKEPPGRSCGLCPRPWAHCEGSCTWAACLWVWEREGARDSGQRAHMASCRGVAPPPPPPQGSPQRSQGQQQSSPPLLQGILGGWGGAVTVIQPRYNLVQPARHAPLELRQSGAGGGGALKGRSLHAAGVHWSGQHSSAQKAWVPQQDPGSGHWSPSIWPWRVQEP